MVCVLFTVEFVVLSREFLFSFTDCVFSVLRNTKLLSVYQYAVGWMCRP